MCICDLSIHKSVWSPADPAILSSSVDAIILFVHILSLTVCSLLSVSSLLIDTTFMV